MTRRTLLRLLGVVFGLGSVAVAVSGVRDAMAWSKANDVCRPETAAAVAAPLADELPVDHPASRDAVTCLCAREAATGIPLDCFDRVDRLLNHPAHADWLPEPSVVVAWLEHVMAAGNATRGRDVARKFLTAPDVDALTRGRALSVLLAAGVSAREAGDLVARHPLSIEERLGLAAVFIERRESEAADALLDLPVPTDLALRREWFLARARSAAARGDADAAENILDVWVAAGEDAGIVMGHRLLILAGEQLSQPRHQSLRDAFELAIAANQASGDTAMLGVLYKRYIGALTNGGLADAAVAAFERARAAGVAPASMTTDLLRRSATVATRPAAPGSREGLLDHRIVLGRAPRGATIWVGHGDDAIDRPLSTRRRRQHRLRA